jgi:hypothetical protein
MAEIRLGSVHMMYGAPCDAECDSCDSACSRMNCGTCVVLPEPVSPKHEQCNRHVWLGE